MDRDFTFINTSQKYRINKKEYLSLAGAIIVKMTTPKLSAWIRVTCCTAPNQKRDGHIGRPRIYNLKADNATNYKFEFEGEK